METENKNRWMTWAIVFLALMNLATVLTIVYQRNKVGKEEVVSEPEQVQSESSSIKYSGRYFRDQLNLSRDQMNRFVEFNPLFREHVRNINYDLNSVRQKMIAEMTSKNCDTIKLIRLSESIGLLHADLKKVTYRYYLDIKNICNQQQQKKLEQLFSVMFVSDEGMGQYGRGGQQRRYRGGRFNN
jgi:hypothetical protein